MLQLAKVKVLSKLPDLIFPNLTYKVSHGKNKDVKGHRYAPTCENGCFELLCLFVCLVG